MQSVFFEMDLGTGFIPCDPPRNWKSMRMQLIFTKDVLQAQLQSINFEWVNKNATAISNYIQNGLNGGTGIFEGIGLKIYVGSSHTLIFDGCLDVANAGLQLETGIVKCPIKESGKVDWLNDVSSSITFSYLAAIGQITRDDYKQIPYTLNAQPDAIAQELMLTITLFILVKEAYNTIEKIIVQIQAISNAVAFWSIIVAVLGLIMSLIYLAIILIECIKMTQELINIILPPKKYKLGMREQDLWVKACNYFGLTFKSSIYGVGIASAYNNSYDNATWMPKKIVEPIFGTNPLSGILKRPEDEINNPDSYGYFEGTFKDFIDVMCKIYNAQIVIQNNTLQFEEIHNFNKSNPYKLPNEGNVGYTFNYPKPYTTNASELNANYVIRFQKDDQEANTYNDYSGTWCVAQTSPQIIRNIKNNLLKGGVSIDLNCCLASRKEYKSKIEIKLLEAIKAFYKFYKVLNDMGTKVGNIINQSFLGAPLTSITSSDIANTAIQDFLLNMATAGAATILIGTDLLPVLAPNPNFDYGFDRIGFLLLSNDFVGSPKRFIGYDNGGGDWYVTSDNKIISSATQLMIDFHRLNLPSANPTNIALSLVPNNQWLLFKNKKFKFSIADYNKVNQNNIFVTADNKTGKFDKIVWDIHNDEAIDVDYRILQDYTNNLDLKITDNGG